MSKGRFLIVEDEFVVAENLRTDLEAIFRTIHCVRPALWFFRRFFGCNFMEFYAKFINLYT